jgi:hypothetical protein
MIFELGHHRIRELARLRRIVVGANHARVATMLSVFTTIGLKKEMKYAVKCRLLNGTINTK